MKYRIFTKFVQITVFVVLFTTGAGTQFLFAETNPEKTSGENTVQVTPARPPISELSVRGRIQGQFAYSDGDNRNSGVTARSYSSFEMRRMRLGLQGKIDENWNFMAEANVLSSVDLDAATLTYTAISQANFTFGKEKPRFGHEQNTSSVRILTVERTRLDGHLNGGKPLGLRLHGSQNIFFYYLGIFNGQTAGTSTMGSNMDRYLYNASAGLNFDQMIGENSGMQLRGDYLHNDNQNGYYDFKNAFALSGHFKFTNFDLRTEYMAGNRHDNAKISGFYVMPSYFIVPETLQAVLRYENVTGDTGIPIRHNRYADRVPDLFGSGNAYYSVYAGLNYFIFGDHLKFMTGIDLASNTENATDTKGRVVTVISGFRMYF